jgi:thiamine-phosphate pyrophosphorylase
VRPAPAFSVYAVSERRTLAAGRELEEALLALGGAPGLRGLLGILFRDKDLREAERRRIAARTAPALAEAGIPFLVHGPPSLARDCAAAGFHLPDEPRLALRELRSQAPSLLMGVSCHDAQGLLRAADADADFVTLGPVLPSPGKAAPGEELGWKRFAGLARSCPIPVFAQGGMIPAVAPAAAAHGASGVAAIRAVWEAADPAAAVRGLAAPFLARRKAP